MANYNGWISVKDKLPLRSENKDWVLGMFQEPMGWINPIPFVCEYIGNITEYTTKDGWVLKDIDIMSENYHEYYTELKCVCWIDIPEPPKFENSGLLLDFKNYLPHN